MSRTGQRFLLLILIGIACVRTMAAAERWSIGLTAADGRIDAFVVAGPQPSAPTVLLIGGLQGSDETVETVTAEITAFEALPQTRRPFRLIALPLANPDKRPLQFPPSGTGYRDNAESHVLWRWIGIQAPDLVVIAGESDAGLAAALSQTAAGFVGTIPEPRRPGEVWNPAIPAFADCPFRGAPRDQPATRAIAAAACR